MKHQALRPLALMLSLLLVASPAQAGTVHILDVVEKLSDGHRHGARVRSVSQDGAAAVASGVAPAARSGRTVNNSSDSQPQGVVQAPAADASAAPVSLVSQDTGQQGGGQVETVDLGDVTGTVCDCGEIPPGPSPKGGFPWWPLLGVPLICLSGICTSDDNPPNLPPTPPPPPEVIPEPATLLLFGSGLLALGAGARRRRRDNLADAEVKKAEVI